MTPPYGLPPYSGPPIPMPPVKAAPHQMGIRMGGLERPLADLIAQHLALCDPTQPYTLVEVGSAGCTTLRAFRDIIASTAAPQCPWRVFGFDLPEDKAWSLDWEAIRRAFDGVPAILRQAACGQEQSYAAQQMYLWLLEDPRSFLRDQFSLPIGFAFIDGSHGKSCGLDFLGLERKVQPGGLVVFHDYGEIEQGTDWQSWDREFISVRSYVHRLGLAAPCVVPRKGWRFVGEIAGSRRFGGDGNSAAVVQRTDEPLAHQPELSLD